MSESNSMKHVYMKPNKPAAEMTEEEIRAFAEELYERIISQMSAEKETDES